MSQCLSWQSFVVNLRAPLEVMCDPSCLKGSNFYFYGTDKKKINKLLIPVRFLMLFNII